MWNRKETDSKPTMMGTFTWLALGLVVIFWVGESAIHVFLLKDGTLIQQIISPGGHELWIRAFVSLIIIAFGIFAQLTVVKQQRAEGEIIAQKEFLENTLESLAHPFYVIDANDYTIKIANSAAGHGGTVDGKTCYELTHREGKPCSSEDHPCPLETVKEAKKPTVVEHIHYDKDGKARHVEVHAFPIFDQKGDVTEIIECCIDITDRKYIEKALGESERRYRQLFEEMQNAFALHEIIRNEQGEPYDFRFLDVNPAFEEFTGLKAGDIIGKTLLEISPEADPPLIDTYGEIVLNGGAAHFEQYAKSLDKYFEIRAFYPSEGRIAVMFSDITDRKRVEGKNLAYQEQLRNLASQLSIAEEHERRRIASELHDRIGQALSISKIKLGSLFAALSSQDLEDPLGEIRILIERTIDDVRSLTFELSPPILYELGLKPAVEWLIEQFQTQHGLNIDLIGDGQPVPLEDDISFFLFQAVRELLMNVLKHAGANRVEIAITRNEAEIQIRIKDDGMGFSLDDLPSHGDGAIGFGLFNIRERLNYIGGRMEIESEPGQGTEVTLVAPLSL